MNTDEHGWIGAMKDRELPLAYARALHDVALAGVIRDLSALRNGLRSEASVRARLEDRDASDEDRRELIDRLLPEQARPEVRNFVYTLVADGRLALLGDVIEELRRIVQYGPEVIVAEVTTAVSLPQEERSSVEQYLVSRYGQGLDIAWRVDPSIIGGLVIRVGDEVIDSSFAGRLEALRESLKRAF